MPNRPAAAAVACLLAFPILLRAHAAAAQSTAVPPPAFGFRNFSEQSAWDAKFLAVPDARLAGEHLRILTAEPHWASSPEDFKTAQYVAKQFKAAGLETSIVPYSVLMNKPVSISVEAFDAEHRKLMSGPTAEHVDPSDHGGDSFQNDPRILPAFNGSSPSADVTAEVVYANYGTLADFKKLESLGVSVKGKIALVRYGGNFRGVKVYIAQKFGAVGVLIYSDPADDGYARGDIYPAGPMRPESAVQRGSVQFLPIYPGDPETPGIASTPDLPATKRIAQNKLGNNWPSIPSNPLSYKDATPILRALAGPNVPHEWQGALPFAYHVGGKSPAVTAHMKLEQDTRLRTIWDVVGVVEGADPAEKDNWVVAGNHRDAWVFGAVDPNSGTAAMLEAAHGIGELLKEGWKPKRRIVLCSWDAEEEGLVGSTEWAEQHDAQLAHAVAYFNTDVAVSGPDFTAAAIPSLKQFVRDIAMRVPSPRGGTVYTQWKQAQSENRPRRGQSASAATSPFSAASNSNAASADVRVGDLGSGSDYTPFIQHLGVPSTDIGSDGPYGVYHSAFDNYNWFIKNADPTFVYEQQQARVFGLEILHMADTDVLPYDYGSYGKEIVNYLDQAKHDAEAADLKLDFNGANSAAQHFATAGSAMRERQTRSLTCARIGCPGSGLSNQGSGEVQTGSSISSASRSSDAALNRSLRAAEAALLSADGLPARPWYRHTIYAPGEFTGYAAVVIPGVNEGIAAADATRAQTQLAVLATALNRAAALLESAPGQ